MAGRRAEHPVQMASSRKNFLRALGVVSLVIAALVLVALAISLLAVANGYGGPSAPAAALGGTIWLLIISGVFVLSARAALKFEAGSSYLYAIGGWALLVYAVSAAGPLAMMVAALLGVAGSLAEITAYGWTRDLAAARKQHLRSQMSDFHLDSIAQPQVAQVRAAVPEKLSVLSQQAGGLTESHNQALRSEQWRASPVQMPSSHKLFTRLTGLGSLLAMPALLWLSVELLQNEGVKDGDAIAMAIGIVVLGALVPIVIVLLRNAAQLVLLKSTRTTFPVMGLWVLMIVAVSLVSTPAVLLTTLAGIVHSIGQWNARKWSAELYAARQAHLRSQFDPE